MPAIVVVVDPGRFVASAAGAWLWGAHRLPAIVVVVDLGRFVASAALVPPARSASEHM